MPRKKTYYIYIMTNQSRNFYIGVTNNIRRRVNEHKVGPTEGFTKRYNLKKHIYVETFSDVDSAIAREKQMKNRTRKKKIILINKENPDWHDLSDGL
ncbi:MAG: GIY-YIG nuclease family protein [Planctomycetes bacterium]|nr:GIY-YIG nuclease family protein [Planctomycetota bacterium]MBL7145128.1 GIY-YIG nuclease family protein [Phycisphaerae bacterium]